MAYRHDGFFYAMDTYRDYQHLNDLWTRRAAPWKLWDDVPVQRLAPRLVGNR
jgi:glucose-1-phosphate cytidylyltransferase